MKKIIKIIRNWGIAILETSVILGLLMAGIVLIPCVIMKIIVKEDIDIKKMSESAIMWIVVIFFMISGSVFARLLFYKMDKDQEVQEKIININNSKITDVLYHFSEFLN